jgi:hypothetical protein
MMNVATALEVLLMSQVLWGDWSMLARNPAGSELWAVKPTGVHSLAQLEGKALQGRGLLKELLAIAGRAVHRALWMSSCWLDHGISGHTKLQG